MTLILGHRGASGYAPENTMEAFRMALQMNADGIELDVQLTKDGMSVVCHDEKIDRTSDGKGFIKDMTFEQLRSYNFNYSKEGYDFCAIPTLEEVLQLFKDTGKIINIELKTGIYTYPGIEKKVLDLVKKYDMNSQIIYSSFNHYTIKHILQMQPDAYCGFLDEDWIIGYGEYAKRNGVRAVHPCGNFFLDEEMRNEILKSGVDVNTWTINEEKDILACLSLNLHAIITNYPDRAVALRTAKEGH